MVEPVKSYEKFNYALRPSKQVERKLFIEALHYLGMRKIIDRFTLADSGGFVRYDGTELPW